MNSGGECERRPGVAESVQGDAGQLPTLDPAVELPRDKLGVQGLAGPLGEDEAVVVVAGSEKPQVAEVVMGWWGGARQPSISNNQRGSTDPASSIRALPQNTGYGASTCPRVTSVRASLLG